MKPVNKSNPFDTIDPLLRFKAIKTVIDKINSKDELLKINDLLQKRVDELNRLKKEYETINK